MRKRSRNCTFFLWFEQTLMASFKVIKHKQVNNNTDLKYKNATALKYIFSGRIDKIMLFHAIINDKLYLGSRDAVYELDLPTTSFKPIFQLAEKEKTSMYEGLVKQGSNRLIVAVSNPFGFEVYDLLSDDFILDVKDEIEFDSIKISGKYLLLYSATYGTLRRWLLPDLNINNFKREEQPYSIGSIQFCTCNDNNVFFMTNDDRHSIKFVDIKNLDQNPKILCTIDKAIKCIPLRLLSNNNIVALVFKGDNFAKDGVLTLLIVDLDSKNMKYEETSSAFCDITEDALIYQHKDFVYVFKNGQVMQYTQLFSEYDFEIRYFTASQKYLVICSINASEEPDFYELHVYSRNL